MCYPWPLAGDQKKMEPRTDKEWQTKSGQRLFQVLVLPFLPSNWFATTPSDLQWAHTILWNWLLPHPRSFLSRSLCIAKVFCSPLSTSACSQPNEREKWPDDSGWQSLQVRLLIDVFTSGWSYWKKLFSLVKSTCSSASRLQELLATSATFTVKYNCRNSEVVRKCAPWKHAEPRKLAQVGSIHAAAARHMTTRSSYKWEKRLERNLEQIIIHGSNHVCCDVQLVHVVHPVHSKIQVVVIGPGDEDCTAICNAGNTVPAALHNPWSVCLW